MKIELYLSDNRDAANFHTDIPEGVSVDIPPSSIGKTLDSIDPITIILTIPSIFSFADLIGKWINTKLENHYSSYISINRTEIEINEGEITRIIKEAIKIENK